MLKAVYNQKPNPVTYMALPTGGADVWLRKNIKEVEHTYEETKATVWECKEVYFRTDKAYAEIESNFDKYWNMYGYPAPTTEERIDALENALMEILEVL